MCVLAIVDMLEMDTFALVGFILQITFPKHLYLCRLHFLNISYKLRKFVSIDTLRTVLCALVYSRLQYGIIVWGTAHKYLLQEINLRLNKLIRICTSNTKFCRISP